MISEFLKNILFNLKKHQYSFNPVFIIGCGRSGTTILGKTLSSHPEIKYLNERRDLWHKSYPEFNISTHEQDIIVLNGTDSSSTDAGGRFRFEVATDDNITVNYPNV